VFKWPLLRPFLYGQLDMEKLNATLTNIRLSAMNFLAMREHSVKELEQKLEKKLFCAEDVAVVIAKLTLDGLQSDRRFAEAFVDMRHRQGKGPLLIELELKARGVSSEEISRHLCIRDDIWNHAARDVAIKKFGTLELHNLKEKAKKTRFLTMRGFSQTNISYALT
jgi:regulatory protein